MSNYPIYCIGDSHVSFFSGEDNTQPLWPKPSQDRLPFFKSFRLGAILAYNLVEYNTQMKGREILFTLLDRGIPVPERSIPPESNVLLCFGEIDCRAHLLKQAEQQKRPVESVVEECANRYFSVAQEVKRLGYDVFLWNVIPSTRFEFVGNKEFPTYGACLERNYVTRLFNDNLDAACATNDITFVSIFDQLLALDGLTNMDFYRDKVHLSQKAMPLALNALKLSAT